MGPHDQLYNERKELILEYLRKNSPALAAGALDRFGHLKYVKGDRQYRLKFMKTVVRVEIQVEHGDGSKSWLRRKSHSFKGLYNRAAMARQLGDD